MRVASVQDMLSFPALIRLLVCTGLLAQAACVASLPAQEMSDARQAIAAAREAGAAKLAADGLATADARLAEAEHLLQQHMYWSARKLALGAKESAIDALLRSRSLRDQGAAAGDASGNAAGNATGR